MGPMFAGSLVGLIAFGPLGFGAFAYPWAHAILPAMMGPAGVTVGGTITLAMTPPDILATPRPA